MCRAAVLDQHGTSTPPGLIPHFRSWRA